MIENSAHNCTAGVLSVQVRLVLHSAHQMDSDQCDMSKSMTFFYSTLTVPIDYSPHFFLLNIFNMQEFLDASEEV
jgi:hypothetical protein